MHDVLAEGGVNQRKHAARLKANPMAARVKPGAVDPESSIMVNTPPISTAPPIKSVNVGMNFVGAGWATIGSILPLESSHGVLPNTGSASLQTTHPIPWSRWPAVCRRGLRHRRLCWPHVHHVPHPCPDPSDGLGNLVQHQAGVCGNGHDADATCEEHAAASSRGIPSQAAWCSLATPIAK